MTKAAEKEQTADQVVQQVANAGFTITPDIVALISAAVAAAVKEANRDEDKEAEKARQEADRQIVRKEEMQRLANMKERQAQCPHLDAYENYAFCGQKNCMGQLVFICSQCFRPFHPTDPDYAHYVRFVKWERLGNARN